MKKLVVGGVLLATLATLAYVMTPAAAAQQRDRDRTRLWSLNLEGRGSTIGVTVRDQSGDSAGVVVEEVREGTPATRAGVQKGDVILEFDGERTRSARQFARLVRETPPGRTVTMTVMRDGSKRTLDVTPEAGDSALRQLPDVTRDLFRAFPRDFEGYWIDGFLGSRRLGVSVIPLSDQLATYFEVKEGVLVSEVSNGSAAADAGIQAGDVITAVNGRRVLSAADIVREVRRVEPDATLDVQLTRNRKEMSVKVTLSDRPERRRAPSSRTLPI